MFLSSIYKSVLTTYKKSEQYKRELALNCVSSILPFSPRSKYYKQGMRGIEKYNENINTKFNLYVDISYLFTDNYKKGLSQCYMVNHGSYNTIFYQTKIIVVSNDYGLSGKDIHSYPFLFFNIDISSFNYIISDICLERDNLFNLCECNPNLVFNKTNHIYADLYNEHTTSYNIEEDIYLFSHLMKLSSNLSFVLLLSSIYEIRLKHILLVFSEIPVCPVTFHFLCPSYGMILTHLNFDLPSDFNIDDKFVYSNNLLDMNGNNTSTVINITNKLDKWSLS